MHEYLPILLMLLVAACSFALGWLFGLAQRKPNREIERLENAVVRARWALACAVHTNPALQPDYDALDAIQITQRKGGRDGRSHSH